MLFNWGIVSFVRVCKSIIPCCECRTHQLDLHQIERCLHSLFYCEYPLAPAERLNVHGQLQRASHMLSILVVSCEFDNSSRCPLFFGGTEAATKATSRILHYFHYSWTTIGRHCDANDVQIAILRDHNARFSLTKPRRLFVAIVVIIAAAVVVVADSARAIALLIVPFLVGSATGVVGHSGVCAPHCQTCMGHRNGRLRLNRQKENTSHCTCVYDTVITST